jgi:hypothetical protein
MTYRVGQVLFVVLNKKMQVYPMMIVEEIVKRTLHGEETNYVLQGGSNPSITILLNEVEGEIFESAEEAKYVLTNRATSQIEKLVDSAIARANEWYNAQQQTTTEIMSLPEEEEASDKIKVTLPDGTIANLKTG